MTVLACLWPIHALLAGIALLLCLLRVSERAVLPALLAVAVVTLAALIHP